MNQLRIRTSTNAQFTSNFYRKCCIKHSKINGKIAGSKQRNLKNQAGNQLSSIHTIFEDKATCPTLELKEQHT